MTCNLILVSGVQCNDLIFAYIVNFIFFIVEDFETALYQLLGVISDIQTVFLYLAVPDFGYKSLLMLILIKHK